MSDYLYSNYNNPTKRVRPQATIPVPNESPASLRTTAMATKEVVETLAGQRGNVRERAVTFQDLLDLGLVSVSDLPQE